jgi:threonine dehydrogenase-like Zn-dependent dehydrogenase
MVEGNIEVGPIITHRVGLEDIHAGLELMKRKECLKVLVYPEDYREVADG